MGLLKGIEEALGIGGDEPTPPVTPPATSETKPDDVPSNDTAVEATLGADETAKPIEPQTIGDEDTAPDTETQATDETPIIEPPISPPPIPKLPMPPMIQPEESNSTTELIVDGKPHIETSSPLGLSTDEDATEHNTNSDHPFSFPSVTMPSIDELTNGRGDEAGETDSKEPVSIPEMDDRELSVPEIPKNHSAFGMPFDPDKIPASPPRAEQFSSGAPEPAPRIKMEEGSSIEAKMTEANETLNRLMKNTLRAKEQADQSMDGAKQISSKLLEAKSKAEADKSEYQRALSEAVEQTHVIAKMLEELHLGSSKSENTTEQNKIELDLAA